MIFINEVYAFVFLAMGFSMSADAHIFQTEIDS
jgi:hypothetical protein